MKGEDWEDAFSSVWRLGGCFLICLDEPIHTSEESAARDQNETGRGAVGRWIGIRDAFFPEKGFVNKAKAMQVKNEHSALGKPNYANLSTFT